MTTVAIVESPRPFRAALLRWFARHGKDYPWRRTKDPYAVWVSEVMLQQTQIATVLDKGYYTRFLEVFPTIHALAAADDADLLKAWEGLGYYRRARMLRETAVAVLANHDGRFPADADALMRLPGIGRYTAGAMRAFAFDAPAVLVDGNVARVLSRLLDCRLAIDGAQGRKFMWDAAAALACPRRPAAYHAALMELGQSHCRPGVPDCAACPVRRFCLSTTPQQLPVKQRKPVVERVTEHALWMRDRRKRILMHHEGGGRRTGLWRLPTRGAGEVAHLPVLLDEVYTITRYRVTLLVHDGRDAPTKPARPGEAWRAPDEIAGLAMAAPFRRVVGRLLEAM